MNEKLDMTLFAQRLKQARNSKGLTQKELSDLSGVSTVMISQYERSDISTGKNPAMNNVFAIATVLEVSIDWLCGLSANQNNFKGETYAFLRYVIELLDNVDVEKIPSNYDGVIKGSYQFEIHEDTYIYKFIEEYLKIQPVVKGDYMPDDLNTTVINTVINKYKDMTICDLLEADKVITDDLPF